MTAKKTTISISEDLKEVLSSFGKHSETYEQIIRRLFFEIEHAWMGGIFDGEGYAKNLKQGIRIVSTGKEILVPFYNQYGGKLKIMHERGYTSLSIEKQGIKVNLDQWMWRLQGRRGNKSHWEVKERFLLDILPYMRNRAKITDVVNFLRKLGTGKYRYEHLIREPDIIKDPHDGMAQASEFFSGHEKLEREEKTHEKN